MSSEMTSITNRGPRVYNCWRRLSFSTAGAPAIRFLADSTGIVVVRCTGTC